MHMNKQENFYILFTCFFLYIGLYAGDLGVAVNHSSGNTITVNHFANIGSQIKQMRVNFTQLWVAVERHKFKWVKM